MSRSRYKIYANEFSYFMTSSFVKGIPIFADPDVAAMTLDSLTFLQEKRDVNLNAYVLMENHFHIVAQGENLSEKMRHFKSFTARKTIDILKQKGRKRLLSQLAFAKLKHKKESDYQVWQESFYPKQIFSDEIMLQKIEYIHNNPVKRGYVDKPEHWRYSSARNYLGIKGLIEISLFNG